MDSLSMLIDGFANALTPTNLLFAVLGVMLGTAVGVLPGIGPAMTVALLLPVTYNVSPSAALIMFAGIYYGGMYGGSTTSILLNTPGESSSVVTALDGHALARKGQAGLALATAAIGSFVAGTVATLLLAVAAPPLAEIGLRFGPAEYFALMVLGLVASIVLARGSLLRAFGMILIGLLLGLVGTDVNSGAERFTFDSPELADGIGFVVLAMGVFGLAEIIDNLARPGDPTAPISSVVDRSSWANRETLRRIAPPIARGTILGSLLGILPGGGAMLASFAAYALEKRLARHPEEFGKGALAGVAAPEAANNAGAQTSFIPMLTLGIPSNPVMALMVGALIIQGITPGPAVMTERPELFWGLVVSMWIGNVLLVVLNLPLIGLWVRLVAVPYHLLFPAILVFCAIGAFSIDGSVFDVGLLAACGAAGVIFRRLGCEPAPMLLGFILGPMMEEYLRRALLLSRGDPTVFITRPLAATLLGLALVALGLMLVPAWRGTRAAAFEAER